MPKLKHSKRTASLQEIQLRCDWFSDSELETELTAELSSDLDLHFEIRKSPLVRSAVPDPTVLVAMVGGASAALAALLTGILRLIEKKQDRSAKLVLRGADGTSIEIPASLSPARVEELARLASTLGKPSFHLSCIARRRAKKRAG